MKKIQIKKDEEEKNEEDTGRRMKKIQIRMRRI